ncbi:hypothetical protein ABLO27_17610 [Roseibium sp. SCPC15]|uniref:hypothetical protein n=1 Tax=Roseibium sp. SCP15 TaxID=3141376 RepID=UPI003339DC06
MSNSTFYVKDQKGRNVLAKHLVDSNGNFIINPRTKAPYVAPASYFVENSITYGRSIRGLWKIDPDKYAEIIRAFRARGPEDLQRSYNGTKSGAGSEFVEEFRDIASFHFGLSLRAAGVDEETAVAGGGLYNGWKKHGKGLNLDDTGDWWNNPRNPPNIRMGSKIYESGRVKLDPEMSLELFPFEELSVSSSDPIVDKFYGALARGTPIKEIAGHQKSGGGLLPGGEFTRAGHPYSGKAVPLGHASGTPYPRRQKSELPVPLSRPTGPQGRPLRQVPSNGSAIKTKNGDSRTTPASYAWKNANPFDPARPRLELQAEILERNPVMAKRMILAADRDPKLFGIS